MEEAAGTCCGFADGVSSSEAEEISGTSSEEWRGLLYPWELLYEKFVRFSIVAAWDPPVEVREAELEVLRQSAARGRLEGPLQTDARRTREELSGLRRARAEGWPASNPSPPPGVLLPLQWLVGGLLEEGRATAVPKV